MNKLEKILAQSVTPEMVAEHLTEQEIEEVIEEYETKIANTEDVIELATEREMAMLKRAEQNLERAEDWKRVAESESKKEEVWRSVVNKAKQALKEKTPSPNGQRAKLIEEAKRFVETNTKKRKIFTSVGAWYAFDYHGRQVSERFTVSKSKRTIKLEIVGAINPVVYKEVVTYCHPNDVWNKHIGKAIALGRALGKDVSKFENAPQPTEIVEGMDVELFDGDGELYASGRALKYDSSIDSLCFSEIYRKTTDLQERNYIAYVKRDGFKITGDTKAKYKEEDK